MTRLNLSAQNTTENIHRLAAQKQLYYEGKKIFLLQFMLTIPFTIALSLTKVLLSIFFKIDIAWLTGIYGILLTITDLTILNVYISRHKKEAAKIQELFDTTVFGIPWNDIIAGGKPDIETVNRYYRKLEKRDTTGKIMDNLLNWYPQEVSDIPRLKAIIICQKSSVNYDFALREKFKNRVFIAVSLTFLILVIFALVENLDIRSVIAQVFFPFVPVLALAIKVHQEHSKSNNNLVDLKSLLDRYIISTNTENPLSVDILRRIQDRIFLNRKESPLIPERLYNKLRDRLEKEMHDNAASLHES